MIWIQRAARAGDRVLKLLYPPRCPLCDRILSPGGDRLCADCRGRLPWVMQPYCAKCGKPLADPREEYCGDCRGHRHYFDQGAAAFTYSGKMRASVQRMKFGGRREYLDFYAEAMAAHAGRWLRKWEPALIVPVPMHWMKKNRRGFSQSELLAKKIGRITGIPVSCHVIRKRKRTAEQKELSYRERRENLRGAFEVTEDLSGAGPVLVIDDVYTTGSTMDEVSRALKEAGAKRVYFLVLCTGKGTK